MALVDAQIGLWKNKVSLTAKLAWLVLFNSPEFLIFFAVLLVCYYLPFMRRLQVVSLLLASFYFYWYGALSLTALLVVSVLVNTLISQYLLQPGRSKWEKTTGLACGVCFNVLILCFFKYGPLVFETIMSANPRMLHSLPKGTIALVASIALPIGVSFYCFEGISLTVDSSRGRCTKSNLLTHLRNTGLFISFFPHLISGPILRASEFFPQIGPKSIQSIDWTACFKWLTLGYFLKIFVADSLAEFTCDLGYPVLAGKGAINNFVMLIGYSAQIFADFAGYSYIALGLAQLLGYSIPDNFNAPYIARSLGEFWKRWHISLSTWIRDYLFIPMGGSHCPWYRAGFNLLFVMVIGGLWHGASWNFALWGLCHGMGLLVEHLILAKIKIKDNMLFSLGRMFATYCFVTFCWMLFLAKGTNLFVPYFTAFFCLLDKPLNVFMTAQIAYHALPVFLLHLYSWSKEHHWRCGLLTEQPLFKACALGIMLFLSVFDPGSYHAFIYFQF